MSILHNTQEIGVTEAAQRGVAGLVADAEQGSDLIVTRHRRPVAVVVGVNRLAEPDAIPAESSLGSWIKR